MMNTTLTGKPHAGNPHIRFDEGEVAPAKPRCGSVLCTNTRGLIPAALGAVIGAFSAMAGDADWSATSTDFKAGSDASTRYDSDQYVVSKVWETAANWTGGVAPGTTLGTVTFTNTLKTSHHWLQGVTWNNDLTIDRLEGNPIRVLAAGTDGRVMTVGDASKFEGVFRSMAAANATLNAIAGYAFSSSTTVPRFAADGYPQLKVANAAHTATVQSLYGRGTVVKTGAGTLNIADGSHQAKVRLQGGTLELPGHSYPDELVPGYTGNFDASASDALTTVTEGDRTYVTKWNATEGSYHFKTTNDVMRPYVRANYANGRAVVDFGAYKGPSTAPGIGTDRWDELGRPAWMEGSAKLSVKSAFYVLEETSRTNNGAVAFGGRVGCAYYRMYSAGAYASYGTASPTYSGVLSSWYENKAMQHGDMRVNNMRVPHDHYEPGGFARMMVYSQSEYAPEASELAVHMLGSDRYARFGGMRLGQFVSYPTVLSTEQIRQNNAHLAKKWLGRVAEAVDADVGAVFVTAGGRTISVPDGSTVAIPAIVGGVDAVNAVVKTGSGTLVVDEINLQTPDFTVNGGAIAFSNLVAKAAPADTAPAADPCFWLKAANDDGSLSDTLVMETVGGTNFVSRWNDCRGNGCYAYVPTNYGKYTPEKPYVTANAANGKPVVDFGLHADYAADKIPGMLFNCEGSGKDVSSVTDAMEAFVMFRHKDASAWQSWIFTSAGGTEFVNSFNASSESTKHRILNYQYADRRTLGADWFRDGRRIDPQDCEVDSDYHVLNFATFNTLTLSAFSIDRWASFNDRGGGIEIGEYIVFDRVLTDAERRQTEAYLLKKWKNMSHPRTSARTVGTLAFADGVTPEISNEGDTAIGEIVTTSDTVKFTGSGTVTLSKPLPACVTKIDAGGVKLVLPSDSVAERLLRGAVLDMDALRTDTMTFDADDPTRVLQWRDANGGNYVADKSSYATNLPQLVDVTVNGQSRKSVCLFDWCLTAKGTSYSDYQRPTNLATGFDLRKTTASSWTVKGGFDAQEFFAVVADYNSPVANTTHRANIYDSAPNDSPCPYRETDNSGNIIRLDYARAPNYSMRVMLDGKEVEARKKVTTNRGKITDFDYHVVTLSVTNSSDTVHTSTIGWTKTGGYDFIWAGKYVAEIVSFTTPLADADRVTVHDYLRKKWLNADVSLPPIEMGAIAVGGSGVDFGTSSLRTAKLSGEGTVTAESLALAENGELGFTFTSADHVGAIVVKGSFALPAAFTVRIGSDPGGLKVTTGEYTLLSATSLTGDVAGMTVVNELAPRRAVRIVKDGNALKAQVVAPGFIFIVR